MSTTPTSEPTSAILQPKIQQRISLRFALGLLAIAALLFGWYFLRDFIKDPNYGVADTPGWIAAIRQTGSGQQAVVLKPDGTVVESPDYRVGAIDRDIVWQPDGQRIFFSSDRDTEAKGFHIYRWNVSPRNIVEQRSIGTRAQEHPTYAADGPLIPPFDQLIISAGVVVDFDPSTSVGHQLIPVESKNPNQDIEGGSSSQFGPEYEHLGTSYREAYWCKNRKYIVGVMRRDDGETLVIQCMQPTQSDNGLDSGLPVGLAAGDHIDIAVDPKSGNVAYAVMNYRLVDPSKAPASMIKNGKIVVPFRNVIGLLNLDSAKDSGPIVAWPKADHAFVQPQVSPDGSQVAFIGGGETADGFKPQYLFVCPLAVGAGNSMTPLASGNLSAPAWSPDGKQIVFELREADGHNDIAQVDAGGGTPKVLTVGKGSFGSPKYSPTLRKS